MKVLENEYPLLPLASGKRQIRLLYLHRRRFTAQIHGTLRVVSLDDGPVYEALSYTWGSSAEERTILLNGNYQLKITDNLYNALTRFRSRSKRMPLWADAVCIDQRHLQERSHQVAMMGDIYRSAERVCIWLGEPQKPVAVHWCHEMAKLLRSSISYLLLVGYRPRHLYYKDRVVQDADASTWPRWYERAWVAQEYASAREVRWICGSLDLYQLAGPVRSISDLDIRIQEIELLKENGDIVQALSEALIGVEASDPRDLVYSTLGILPSDTAQLIRPDYSLSCETVFAQATYACISHKGDFSILEHHRVGFTSALSSLPSWAMDFTLPKGAIVDSRTDWPCKLETRSFVASVDDLFTTLEVEGVLFDIVDSTLALVERTDGQVEYPTPQTITAYMRENLASDNERALTYQHEGLDQQPWATPSLSETCYQLTMLWDTAPSQPIPESGKNDEELIDHFCDGYAASMKEFPDQSNLYTMTTFVTRHGYLGFASSGMRAGDSLVLCKGARLPFILRPQGDYWTFHGFAWVYGIHRGRLLELWRDVELEYKRYRMT